MVATIEEGTYNLAWHKAIYHNIKGIPQAFTWSALFSGMLIVFISTTGPIAILFQAANAGQLSDQYTASWLFAVFIGSGVFGLLLSLRYRMPIIGSWASTVTALLVTGLVDHPLPEVVAAYFLASIILLFIGMTGIFSRIMSIIPHAVIMAMLAGVLFSFGLRIFTSSKAEPLIGFGMILIYFLGRRLKWRAPVFGSLFVGVIVAILQSKLTVPRFEFQLVEPVWINPVFSPDLIFTLVIPIVLMVMTTQNATGISLIQSAGYKVPINNIVTLGGFLSILGAGFGGAGVNVSAMTAIIALGPEADPNPQTRYFAGISTALTYIFAGLFAGIFLSLYASFPPALTTVLAGLALLPVISASIAEAVLEPEYRDAAIVTFLISVSGISGWGVGAPFWGLLGGFLVHHFISFKKRA